MSSLLETKLEALRVNEERIKEARRVLKDEIEAEKNREKRKCGIATLEASVDDDKKYIASFNPSKEERRRIMTNNVYMEIILDILHHQEERIKVLEQKMRD